MSAIPLRFPRDRKIYGCNIASKKSYGVDTAYGAAWLALWNAWDWDGWIKPQIDWACGNNIGCNCIRLIGSLEGVYAGTFTQNTYNSRWIQLVEYCASLGVYVYFTGGWFPQVSPDNVYYPAGAGANMTDQQIADGINATLSALSGYRNIIAADLMQENDWWPETFKAERSVDVYNKVKAGGTALPCTFSSTKVLTDQSSKDWFTSIAGAFDMIDHHIYAMVGYDPNTPIVLSDMNYWLSTYSGYDIIFGEFGSPQSASADTQNNYFHSVLGVASSGNPYLRGAQAWACTDGNDVTTDEWGLFDVTFATGRRSKILPFRERTDGSPIRRN